MDLDLDLDLDQDLDLDRDLDVVCALPFSQLSPPLLALLRIKSNKPGPPPPSGETEAKTTR